MACYILHSMNNIIITQDIIIEIVKSGDIKYLEKIRKALLEEHETGLPYVQPFGVMEYAINDKDDIDMLVYLHEKLHGPIGIRALHKALVIFGKPMIKTLKYILLEGNTKVCQLERGGLEHVFFNTFESLGTYSWYRNQLQEIIHDKSILKWILQKDLSAYPQFKMCLDDMFRSDPALQPKKKKMYAPISDNCSLRESDEVIHKDDKIYRHAKIVDIHYDAYPYVYYTIEREDGKTIQTTSQNLFCINQQ